MTDNQEVMRMALEALEAFGNEAICQATHHKKKDQHGAFDACPNASKHQQAIALIKAAIESDVLAAITPVQVPDGFVLVPVEPISMLVEAGYYNHYRLETTLGRQLAIADYSRIITTALAIQNTPSPTQAIEAKSKSLSNEIFDRIYTIE